MFKFLGIILLCLSLSGCLTFPRVTFDTPNTVPQQTEKSKAKEVCKGKAEFNEVGDMISCTKGYYNYEEGYSKKERKMNIIERIKSFINNLAGWSFWVFVALVILTPGLVGTVLGRIVEGTIGIASVVLKRLVKAIQKSRKEGKDLNISLESELDEKDKKYIKKIKDKEGIK